ncbi:hypothetical protein JG687_00002815 [Phytophthora cactorum]|uniref:Uncharacterized protein n=1 Tax=Phytophthora cactorum TaxID=29920 RepID=A0A8T1UTD8_9STRA|nr:hypothetical protein JG687_00002815 [Phytophthora cactorum]
MTVLLGMAPLINESDGDMSAQTHIEFLSTMLLRDSGALDRAVPFPRRGQLLGQRLARHAHWWVALTTD